MNTHRIQTIINNLIRQQKALRDEQDYVMDLKSEMDINTAADFVENAIEVLQQTIARNTKPTTK